ncbi:MAG: hypothetical protein D4R74_09110 [Betaproteobacteria bacterium]|nr:MAG: hypothetical protein D4R74_09110 [Betaproteobacteria bacterium]
MKKLISALFFATILAAGVTPAGAATTDIATVPVLNVTGTGSIKPNIMLMLDDSGSMGWDYTPDYVNDNGKCFDGGSCGIGYPPYFAPEFNYQYYSPDILYSPGVTSTGTSFGAQTTFTAVKTDPYGVQQRNQSGSSMSTENIVANYPDRVYCNPSTYTGSGDLTNTAICKKNSAYTYPDPSGGTFTSVKSVSGAPYYYRIATTTYCSDFNLTTCISATSPAGGYIYPAAVRWCTSATSNFAYTNCQRNYDPTHTTPEFIGTVKPASPSAAAYGVVSVATAGSQYSISDMQVNGVSIINASVTGTSAANFATNLATAINSSSFHSSPEYGACVGTRNADNSCTGAPNSTVTIFPQTASCGTGTTNITGCTAIIGSVNNGKAITYSGPNVAGTPSTGTITVGSGPAGSAPYALAAVLAGGSATISTSAIGVTGDLSTAAGRNAAAAAIAAKIGAGFSATTSGNVVTITATSTGTANNLALGFTSGAVAAQATITVGSITKNVVYDVASISAGGTLISTGLISASSSSNNSSTRQSDIASAIAAGIGVAGYSATSSGNTVTITAPSGAAGNTTLTYAADSPAATATGSATLTVGANPAGSTYDISTITMGSTTVASNISCPGNASATVVATCVKNAINAAGTNFTATAPANVVTITPTQTGTYANGALAVSVPSSSTSAATFTVTAVSSTPKANGLSVVAGGACSTNASIWSGGTSGNLNSTSAAASTYAAGVSAPYSASSAGSIVTVTGPGATLVGCTLAPSWTSGNLSFTSGTFAIASKPMVITASGSLAGGAGTPQLDPVQSSANFTGGVDSIPISSFTGLSGGTNGNLTAVLSVTNFAGGVDGNATPIRMNVGTFTRTNIVACAGGAADPCYPKVPARTDCAAAGGCTYNEEMINFSNWYAYYRTRMQTMKSAASLAFSPLGASYRVGFAKLSNVGYGSAVDITPEDFNTTNRAAWYTALFAANPSVATPLRVALDAMGKMYANLSPYNYSGAARVVQYPCQQNFVILTTDGFWNGGSSASITNNDNTENASRFCTKANGCFDGVTSSPTVPSLADTALYWYNGGSNTSTVSLRPDLEPDVSKPGVVPAGPSDPNTHLHMTTFTLGLGVSGYMNYEANYDTAPSAGGDYYKLITAAGSCPWNGGGTYVWPNPVADTLTAVDDLWHAAVNGHGKYFSARNPASVVSGLAAAIAAMAVRTGAASAAATSTPNVSQQDNDIFSATFTTVKWYGELFDQKIDPVSGNVNSAVAWNSSNTLGNQVASATDTRTIKMLNTATGTLKDFSYSAMSALEQSWFDNKSGPAVVVSGLATAGMVQYGTLSAADRITANNGANLVNWFRGQTQHADDILYRAYTYTTVGTSIPIVLGDIDTAKPAYMRDPRKQYSGTYGAFVLANKTRSATVFAAANDGMLHAFNAATGSERWAYAPRITMSKLWKQAATDYGSNHQFSTDGSPEIADVQIGGVWKTVLVGGLNAGGRGYYAIDVTDPTTPVALWEFCADSTICSKTDPDMGLTFGNPQFGYWNNKWVVVVTSGYNNVAGIEGVASGDGVGYLYVLDVATGAILKKISTGAGNSTTPSGLARITAITSNPQADPNITYVYGGDNEGNVWRFDFTDPTFATIPVLKIATLGSGQPVTTRPDVSLCQTSAGLKRVVLLGSGRLLGVSDTTTTGTQSVFLVKDSDTALGALRGKTSMIPQVMSVLAGTGGSSYTLASPAAVNLATDDGWYIDLTLNNGERVNLDPKIVFSTAVVVSNLPISGSACTVGGTSYNYQFSLCTGSYSDVTSKVVGGVLSSSSAAVGFIVIKLPSGTVKMITTTADGSKLTTSVKATASAAPRKSGWRTVKN